VGVKIAVVGAGIAGDTAASLSVQAPAAGPSRPRP
jgi:predicted NAD/FAD-binding protein